MSFHLTITNPINLISHFLSLLIDPIIEVEYLSFIHSDEFISFNNIETELKTTRFACSSHAPKSRARNCYALKYQRANVVQPVYTESGIIPYLRSAFSFIKHVRVNVSTKELFNIYVSVHYACEFTYKLLDYLIFVVQIIKVARSQIHTNLLCIQLVVATNGV